MSITRHHNDWLSLLEVSGPFLSLPVLLRVFPQGLDALDKAQAAEARLAYEEWLDNQKGSRPEPAIHALWVRYVLYCVLGFEKASLLEGPAIPTHLKATVAEHGETLRPDLAIRSPLPQLGEGATQASSGVRAQGLRALITVYPCTQKLESPFHERRWKASPATRMMELLRATGMPLGLATNGEQWMLVHAPRGETTSFISWYASLWFEEPVTLRAFTALLGAGRTFGVAEEDTLESMLRLSANQQQEVTDQLGYQVRRAVEVLIRALDKADQDQGRRLLQGIGEGELYEAALTVMMRLVFLFSAEERGLLLLDEPIYYQNYAVSTLRAQLREAADQQGEEVLERRFDAWCRLIAAFRAVHNGIQHDRLHLPAYGGSLFNPEKYPFLEGRRSRKDAKAQSEKDLNSLSDSAPLREIRITPEGKLSTGASGETIIPSDDEERLILARRLVADRCIYGVDKNPLAVEIAKLSIWLTTMDKGRPFSFLDHALKCGDSLVGASADDFLRWARGWRGTEGTLFDSTLQDQIELARQKRRELESFEVLDVHDTERKAGLLAEAEAALARVKRGCDLLVGARLLGLSEKETEELQLKLLFPYMAGEEEESELARLPLALSEKVRAYHWELEFPEVFEKRGFEAIIGNPPFLGGKRISSTYGKSYSYMLPALFEKTSRNADICAFFFRRAFSIIRGSGMVGLLATNTISEGETRDAGLKYILEHGGKIVRANHSFKWPGSASVHIAYVQYTPRKWKGKLYLEEREVSGITHFLEEGNFVLDPYNLLEPKPESYIGTVPYGDGFVLTPNEAVLILNESSIYKNVIKPYFNGDDINTFAPNRVERYIINFGTMKIEEAKKYPVAFDIVEDRVKRFRLSLNPKDYKTMIENWWIFWRPREELYKKVRLLDNILVLALTTKYISPTFLSSSYVYDQTLICIPTESFALYAVLQSSLHTYWAIQYGATLGEGYRYNPTRCYSTFPIPSDIENLHTVGKSYWEKRDVSMKNCDEGLTAFYNRFHNPKEKASDIARMRSLHVEMDNAVAAAYGWSDLDLGHDFLETPQGVRYTISEAARREVLSRLLKLNHERYEEEVKAGLYEKKKSSSKQKGRAKSPSRKKKGDQMKLL